MVAQAELGPAGCDGGAETEDSDGGGGGHLWIWFGVLDRFCYMPGIEMYGRLDELMGQGGSREGIIPSALPGTTTSQISYKYLVVDHGPSMVQYLLLKTLIYFHLCKVSSRVSQ